MNVLTWHHIGFIGIFSLLGILRTAYKLRNKVPLLGAKGQEPVFLRILRMGLGLGMVWIMVEYFYFRQGFGLVEMPAFLRVTGILVGVLCLILLNQVHRDLGTHFSTTLEIKGDPGLVTTGTYRWMRHPMYTVYFLLMISGTLISGHGMFGFFSVGIILSLMILRLGYEETMLSQTYGKEWHDYCGRTGRFTPFRALLWNGQNPEKFEES